LISHQLVGRRSKSFVQKHYLQFSGWIETLHGLSELFHLLLLLLVNFDFSSTGWSAVKVFGAT